MFSRHLAGCLTLIRHLTNRRTFVCQVADPQALMPSA
jgi:hypothetical protein